MMRLFHLFLVLIFSFSAYAVENIRVIDDVAAEPVAGASVFNYKGAIIGFTDDTGCLNNIAANNYPLTIRCLGYVPAQCAQNQKEVRLESSTYSLNEVVVTPVNRPILRVVCYIREYASMTDNSKSLVFYNEHMGDFFLPVGKKAKGFKKNPQPRFLTSDLYMQISNKNGEDSIFKPLQRIDDFTWEEFVEYPSNTITDTISDKYKLNGDTIVGKYGIKHIIRRPEKAFYSITTDELADHKNHTWSPWYYKMLGLTVDVTEYKHSWLYQSQDSNSYKPTDIIVGTINLGCLAKGKLFKKIFKTNGNFTMNSFYEIYPVEFEYLTNEEARELYDNPPIEPMNVSHNAQPLDQSLQRIINSCNNM